MSTFKKCIKSKFETDKVFDDPSVKKAKFDTDIDACGEFRKKILILLFRQLRARKQSNAYLKDLQEIVANLETGLDALKDNVKKVEQLLGRIVNRMQQTTTACSENLKAVRGLILAFKKKCKEMDAVQRVQSDKLEDQLAEDIQKMKQKLIAHNKRIARVNIENYFLKVIYKDLQNNFK